LLLSSKHASLNDTLNAFECKLSSVNVRLNPGADDNYRDVIWKVGGLKSFFGSKGSRVGTEAEIHLKLFLLFLFKVDE
jgi:hypothetical protein